MIAFSKPFDIEMSTKKLIYPKIETFWYVAVSSNQQHQHFRWDCGVETNFDFYQDFMLWRGYEVVASEFGITNEELRVLSGFNESSEPIGRRHLDEIVKILNSKSEFTFNPQKLLTRLRSQIKKYI